MTTGDIGEDGLVLSRDDVVDGVRVTVVGELTMATRDGLASYLIESLDGGPARVEIDLTGVKFMDSQGLWALMRARQHAEDAGEPEILRIVAASHPVRRLLEMTTLDQLFGYEPPPT